MGCAINGVLPLPMPPRPLKPSSKSARLRQRFGRRLNAWKVTVGVVSGVNHLVSGSMNGSHRPMHGHGNEDVLAAQKVVLGNLLSESARFARGRREHSVPTGDRQAAVVRLVRAAREIEGYVRIVRSPPQVPMVAEAISEPSSELVVDMLEALPPREANFYKLESNCIDWKGKSQTILDEMHRQYAFVGGSLDQDIAYFKRSNLPNNMWTWRHLSQCKAIGGFSVVPKKDGVTQRKLLMEVPLNYLLSDVRDRSHLGMDGAGALTRLSTQSGKFQVACCDQSNAFSYVQVPEWLSFYQATPPIPAGYVWEILPLHFEVGLDKSTLISACYNRLAMGCAHAVHILMSINMRSIGMSLRSSQLLTLMTPDPPDLPNLVDDDCAEAAHVLADEGLVDDEDEVSYGCSDELWHERRQARLHGQDFAAGFSLAEWIEACMASRNSDVRTFVVMNFFSGERRKHDLQEWVERFCAFHGLRLLMISADLATDSRWNLAEASTFHELLSLCEAFVDVVIGGPPCATTSRVRHNRRQPGPRPVRFRHCVWGRNDLSPSEYSRVKESNNIWLHFLALCEATSLRGGGHAWEHPGDPGQEPYSSIWITPEMIESESRAGAVRKLFRQCTFGGPRPKFTCLSATLLGLEQFNDQWCPGVSIDHQHQGQSEGLNELGLFHTSRLQTYPPDLCKALAWCIFFTLQRMKLNGAGPSGFTHPFKAILSVTAYSANSYPEFPIGIEVLNEAVVHGRRVHLSASQAALYLHVDDTIFFVDSDCPLDVDALMRLTADGMEKFGFLVPERVGHLELESHWF